MGTRSPFEGLGGDEPRRPQVVIVRHPAVVMAAAWVVVIAGLIVAVGWVGRVVLDLLKAGAAGR